MLNDSIVKIASKGSIKVTQLSKSVAISEERKGDRFNWGNGTESEPAFLVYLGCREEEISGYLKTLNTFYRCSWSEIRKPKYLRELTAEIKIRGMQRYSDSQALGLDYLIESESAKQIGCDPEEYDYYTTGVRAHW